jgi:hypothetical protein
MILLICYGITNQQKHVSNIFQNLKFKTYFFSTKLSVQREQVQERRQVLLR